MGLEFWMHVKKRVAARNDLQNRFEEDDVQKVPTIVDELLNK